MKQIPIPPRRRKARFGAIAAGLALAIVPAGAQITPGYDFYIDARQDTDGDDRSEDLTPGNPSGQELLIDTSVVNRVATTTTTKLTEAYDLPGGSTGNVAGLELAATNGSEESFANARNPGDWSNKPVSIEIWFRPDNLTPTPSNGQIVFEDGGGTGLGIFIDANELVMAHDGNQNQITYNLLTDPSNLLLDVATSEFIHVVVTHDTSSPFLSQMFVNGSLVGTSNDDGDWSGGDDAAFGTRGAANTGGRGGGQNNTESFDGQIALVRVYQGQILTAAEVQANFDEDKLGIPNQTRIVLAGDNPQIVERATAYTELGVTEVLDVDAGTPITGAVAGVAIDATGVDVNTLGTYSVVYSYDAVDPLVDSETSRTVIVVDTQGPTVTPTGGNLTISAGSIWVDPGATAIDANGGESVPVVGPTDLPDPARLLAKYSFDDDTGDDSTINGLHGTAVGTPVYSDDTPKGFGRSVDFSGGNNAFYINDGTPDQDIFDPAAYYIPVPADQLRMTDVWTVESTENGGASTQNGENWLVTNQEITDAVTADPVAATSTWDLINFGSTNGTEGQIRMPRDEQYPRANTNGPDNIAFRASGTLRVPADGDYEIGFRSDDGCSLAIYNTGSFFTDLNSTAGGASLIGPFNSNSDPETVVNTGSVGSPDGDLVGDTPGAPADPWLEGGSNSGSGFDTVDFGQPGALVADGTFNTDNTAVALTVSGVGDTLNTNGYQADLNPADPDISAALANDLQEITINGPGEITLSDGVDTTLAFTPSDAATLETRLETDLTAVDDVTVTGTGTTADPFVVTFVGAQAGTDVPELFSDTTYARNEVQVLEIIFPGGITLSYNGETTAEFDPVEAADVEAALESLTGIDDVAVVSPDFDVYEITFLGGLAGTDVAQLVPADGLGGGEGAVTTQTEGDPAADSVTVVTLGNGNVVAAAEFTSELWLKLPGVLGTGNGGAFGGLQCPVSNIWFNQSNGETFAGARAGWLFYVGGADVDGVVENHVEFRLGSNTAGYLTGGFNSVGLFEGGLQPDQWYHIVGVCRIADKSDPTKPVYQADLYVNGVLVNTLPALPDFPTVNLDADIRVGATTQPAGGTGQNLTGTVDELALYPAALDAATIAAHYANGINDIDGAGAPRDKAYQTLVGESSPLGYWRMNDADQPFVIDTTQPTGIYRDSYTGGNTTATISLTAGDYPVKFIHREGTGGEFVDLFTRKLGDTEWIPLTNEQSGMKRSGALTVSFWAKRSGWANGNWDAYLGKRGEGGQGWKIRRYNNTDNLTLTSRGTGNDEPRGAIDSAPDGSWHHIAVRYDGETKDMWVDGVKDPAIDGLTADGPVNPAVGYPFMLGAYADSAAVPPTNIQRYFQGQMDEISIYKEPLSDTEIVAHAAGGQYVDTTVPGVYTVGYIAIDESGNTGSATRTVTVVADATAPVIVLNGEPTVTIDASTAPYEDPGAGAFSGPGADPPNEPLGGDVTVTGTVDNAVPGIYVLTYTYPDALPVERTVIVEDQTGPAITLNGPDTITITEGQLFVDPGATTEDFVDGSGEADSDGNLVNPPQLVGNWTFDDDGTVGDIGAVLDSSGNDNHATSSFGAVYIDDTNPGDVAVAGGRAIDLSQGDDYVIVEDSVSNPDFEMREGPFSVSCWVKGWPDNDWEPFVGKRGESGQGWQLRKERGNQRLTITTRGAGNENGPGIDVPDITGWNHFVGIHDGTQKWCVVNGTESGKQSQIGSVNDAINSAVVFGARDNNSGGTNIVNHSRVRMDDVKIYHGTLTPEHIATLATGADITPYPAAGEYTVTYTATDNAGNETTLTRTVIVEPATGGTDPVLTVAGVNGTTVSCSLAGTPNTTFAIKSWTDEASGFSTVETTVPEVLDTGESGSVDFTIDTAGRAKLLIRAEQQ